MNLQHQNSQQTGPAVQPAAGTPPRPLPQDNAQCGAVHPLANSPLRELQSSQRAAEGALWRAGSASGSQLAVSDRFIPSRTAAARLDFSMLDREVVTAAASKNAADREDLNPAYNLLLRSELLGGGTGQPVPTDKAQQLEQLRSPCSPAKKLFRYMSGDAISPMGGGAATSPFARLPVGGPETDTLSPFASPTRTQRRIARAPYKVLDAPALQDDFYLNLVDWSAQNVVAVGLGSCVYLWAASTSKVTKLCDLSSTNAAESVTSVSWSRRGTYLAVGCSSGAVQLWDVAQHTCANTLTGHKARVGTLAWSSNVLCSGSRDRSIAAWDMRCRETTGGPVARLTGHRSEVCGMKWSLDDRQLASGGNDNQLCVWELRGATHTHNTAPNPSTATGTAACVSPLLRFTDHTAAVKALAWSPHQYGLLASGGGTADRCIRFWNTATGAALNHVDTGSQVCNLCWSRNVNELVSTHGYSQNQIVVWKYPSMAKLATLTGHTLRVLYLASSPDGQSIVTGAGDETLRFWSVFPGAKAQGPDTGIASFARASIR